MNIPTIEGGWNFVSYKLKTGRFVALAKRGEFVTGEWITEPGDVWFEVADTEEQCLSALRKEANVLDLDFEEVKAS